MAGGSQLRLRAPKEGDLPEILRIERDAFGADAFTARQFRHLFFKARALTLIADVDGATGGYGSILLPALPRPARIYTLAVAPAFRGRGIALALCRAMIGEACGRGYDRLRLEVSDRNAAGQHLYAGLGFARLMRLPRGYYADGSGGWRMELSPAAAAGPFRAGNPCV